MLDEIIEIVKKFPNLNQDNTNRIFTSDESMEIEDDLDYVQ